MSKRDRNTKFKPQYPRYVTVQRPGWDCNELWEIIGDSNPGASLHSYSLKSTKTGELSNVWAVCTKPATRENVTAREEYLNRMSENAQKRRNGHR